MSESPLVSVFIPVYNAASLVAQAIESVLAQTYQHYELIVVNDASTDGTAEVIARYQDHPKVRIHHNPTNLGTAPNWNMGVSLCEGDLIARLDADDLYTPGFLERVVPIFQRYPDVGMVFTGAKVFWPFSKMTEELPYRHSWVRAGRDFLPELLRGCRVRSPTACVRRTCYQQLGPLVDELRIHHDWEMWVRIAANYDVGYLAEPLAYYRFLNPGGCTAQAISDGRSIGDCRLWLDLLAGDALPYRLNSDELSLLKEGMHDLIMTFAVYAMDEGLNESLQRYLSFAEILLPEGTRGSPYARLYTWAAAVYLAERRGRARACYFLLKSLSYGLPYQAWWRVFKKWVTRWCIREAIRLFGAGAKLFPG
jgi:glycosyltransferase involved in cell wall biosynthesis